MDKKAVIIYASKHHGNTYKLVKAISEKHKMKRNPLFWVNMVAKDTTLMVHGRLLVE